jgi:hypothetical protein
MGAGAYIGRVGSLAVALGVGTAIATGHGIAVADDTSAGSSSSGSSASSSSTSSGSTSSADTAKTAPSASDPTSKPETPSATSEPTAAGTPTATSDKPPSSTTTDTVGGVVVSAQTNIGSSGSTPEPAKPETTPEPTASATAAPTTPPAADPTTESTTGPTAEPAASPATKKSTPNDTVDTASTPTQSSSLITTTSASTAETQAPKAESTVEVAAAPPTVTVAQPVAMAMAKTAAVVQVSAVTPTTPAPAAPQSPLEIVGNMISSVVNWVLSPLMGSGSTAPAEPPLAWSLLAFARREFDDFVAAVTGGATAAPAAAVVEPTSLTLAAATTALAQAAVSAVNVPAFPLPGAQLSPSTQFVQWVTGNYQTGNPLIADTLNRFSIDGTDVGVIWDNGMVDDPSTPYNEHQVLMAFGDTFSGANMTGNWRFNVLLRSADTVLSDGVTIPNGEWFNGNMFGGTPLSSPTTARQIIHPDGLPAGITLIPTAGVSIPTPGTQFGVTQYVNFMSVTNWGAPGTWTTNYSAIAYSTDNGENWSVAPTSVRYNDPFSGNGNFQQGAFVRPGDGYVYSYGTPNGRQGYAYVSRVAEKDILDTSKYEYYNAGSAGGWFGWGATPSGWYKNQPAKASAVFGQDTGACGVANPGNQVSEMSVQYNKQLKKYVVLYGDQFNNIVMRTSDTPQGGWSAAKVLMGQQSGGIYAPMMHPWSPSTMGTGTDLYWNLSLYSEYNVMLMKTDLTKL